MDELFKLIFYIIIGIVWILSNTKKKTDWQEEEDKINLPPRQPRANPLPKPKMDQPSREGIFFEDDIAAPFDQFKQSYDDKKLEMKKKRLQEKKRPIPAEVFKQDFVIDIPKEKKTKPSLAAVVANRRQKQSYHLKSSLKEGIIWSIVLGAPRSKQAYNWQASPLNR